MLPTTASPQRIAAQTSRAARAARKVGAAPRQRWRAEEEEKIQEKEELEKEELEKEEGRAAEDHAAAEDEFSFYVYINLKFELN